MDQGQQPPSFGELFIEWVKDHSNIFRTLDFFHNFWYIWGGLIGLLLVALFSHLSGWVITTYFIGLFLALITGLILLRPMNAVYGMMGASGSVPVFFITFILISVLFAGIYHWGFFKDAGITYDVNQPHIDYNLYAQKCPKEEVVQSDTLVYKKMIGSDWLPEGIIVHESKLTYQPISFWLTWRNTILTALMQEPTELFSAASTYNESMVDPSLTKEQQKAEILLDKQKAKMFQWILILQVLISWIFFGVFISLLYNKFRYES